MRKFSAFMMVLAMLLTLAACSAPTEPVATESNDTVTVSTAENIPATTLETAEESTATPETDPAAVEEDSAVAEAEVITVSTVDEFLAALGSNRTIQLAAGIYNLSDASNYGRESNNPCYNWYPSAGNEHHIWLSDLQGLTILGSGVDQTIIEIRSREDGILTMLDSVDITFQNLTIGRTEKVQKANDDDALSFKRCSGINLEGLNLRGCGTGLTVMECQDATVSNCRIYDNSLFGVCVWDSDNVSITNCTIDHIGAESEAAGSALVISCNEHTSVENCTVSDSVVNMLVQYAVAEENFIVKNTEFRNNRVLGEAIQIGFGRIVLDNCTFKGNTVDTWYHSAAEKSGKWVLDGNGASISFAELIAQNGCG